MHPVALAYITFTSFELHHMMYSASCAVLLGLLYLHATAHSQCGSLHALVPLQTCVCTLQVLEQHTGYIIQQLLKLPLMIIKQALQAHTRLHNAAEAL
jgi:hypothetical protein